MDPTDAKIRLNFTHIPSSTKQAFDILSKQSWLKEQKWYLAGGTALTLQFDHRISVDLDFFNPKKDLDFSSIFKSLSPDWITTNREKDTLYGELRKAKVSFIAYAYFIPTHRFIAYGNINILDAQDIAVMKIIAISQRGRKRDFFDLYWYITHQEPLIKVIKKIESQYPRLQHNYHHIIKSLTYFEEAEDEPEPQILFDATWAQVKNHFLTIVPKVAEKFFS